MTSAADWRDALVIVLIVFGALGVPILYYCFVYPAGFDAFAVIGVVLAVRWFATPSTDKS